MGVQTVSSHGGGGGGGALTRQGSVYGLTLSEVESHLGEPLRSMNLDDLLRTVLPAAAAEPRAAAVAASKKTVDEVWRDIERTSDGGGGSRARQPTMGEMTLEDFLSRAGVAVDAADVSGGCTGAYWLQQYQPPVQQNGLDGGLVGRPVPRPLGVGTVAGGFFLEPVVGRKRGAAADGGVVERTLERRQKRMIKNRESAARSRARKQAYTNELENKISRLEEENERLRKQKELQPVVQYLPQQDPKHQLRRTSSASF